MDDQLRKASRLIADELRRAERSINAAARDTAQFLLTTLDVTDGQALSPSFAHRTVKATVDALAALVDGQQHLALRAHPAAEKVGNELGLTVVDWGEGAPKPTLAPTGRSLAESDA